MARYLIVAEDVEDGTWWDEPDVADTKDEARKYAIGRWEGRVPEGHEIMIYPLGLGERVEIPRSE